MEQENKMSDLNIKEETGSPPPAVQSPFTSYNMNCSPDGNHNTEEKSDNISNEQTTGEEASETKMSKSQLRKLKRQEKWLAHKDEKRAKERLKKKQRKKEAMERGEDVGPTRKKLKQNTMAKSSCQVKVVIDCSLDSYMAEKDIIKLVKQIQFCYSTNRRADNPLQFYVTGVRGQTKERLEAIGDFKNWDVNFTEDDYTEVFDHSKIVYLSSDSSNVLCDLDPDTAYIIGGLVDHNHHKGLCHQKAVEKGVSHAQLPISDYIDLKSRKVLTINHVFDILLRYSENRDWQKTFFSVLPQRKGVKLKDNLEQCENKISDLEKTLQNGVLLCPTEFEKKPDKTGGDCDSWKYKEDKITPNDNKTDNVSEVTFSTSSDETELIRDSCSNQGKDESS